MILAYILGFRSMWRQSVGDFKSEDGKEIVRNVWNSKSTYDYLAYMKFECMQFIWHGSFFFVNLYSVGGIEWSTIYINFKDPEDEKMFNMPPAPSGVVAITCACTNHVASIMILCIILRRGEADKQDTQRFKVLTSTLFRKFLMLLIASTGFTTFLIALWKTFSEADFRAYNKFSAWINVEAASFLFFIVYFIVVKFQFDLNHANK